MITKRSRDYTQHVTRRGLILGGAQVAIAAGLLGRLYYLQGVEGTQYNKLSESNKYDFRQQIPRRGRLYDTSGRLLAGNAEAYALSIIPDYTENMEKVLHALSRLIRLSDEDIGAILEEASQTPPFLPIVIRADLTQREVARLVIRSPELPGVNFEKTLRRIYPHGLLASHLTGYINKVTEEEIKSGVITKELALLSIGKSGAEKAFEVQLRGKPGRERILVNALGKRIRTTIDEESQAGRDITLTADMRLQQIAVDALKRGKNKPIPRDDPRAVSAFRSDEVLASSTSESEEFVYVDSKERIVPPESGAVIAVDVRTGAIKCIASAPVFDSNVFAGRLSPKDWNTLVNHPRRPLLNRALAGQYAPGSTFKMVVALAALEAKIVNPSDSLFCVGHRDLGDTRFHCWKEGGHGRVNLLDAIEQSCDVFFYNLGIKVGIERIADMARRLGFGEMTGIALPGEKPGLVPTKEWKRTTHGGGWALGETVNVAIGQGYILATPLQLAMMTARLANGSKKLTPTLTSDEARFDDLDIDPEAMALVQRGMRQVMAGEKGTARWHDIKGVGMAGKTGTVQVRAISAEEREEGVIRNEDRFWEYRDHALFVGYAPYDEPRYAVAVVVEHGGGGASVAAPVGRVVLQHMLKEQL